LVCYPARQFCWLARRFFPTAFFHMEDNIDTTGDVSNTDGSFSGDNTVSDYSAPSTATNDNFDFGPFLAATAPADTTSTLDPNFDFGPFLTATADQTSNTASSLDNSIGGIAKAASGIAGNVKSIFGSITGSNVSSSGVPAHYDSSGNFHPATGGIGNGGTAAGTLSNAVSQVSSVLKPMLPYLLIGGLLWIVVTIFGKKRK
jgi:hypothetical protein